MNLYIATNGNDHWSGLWAAPNAQRTDGPLATLDGARRRIREGKQGARQIAQYCTYRPDRTAAPEWGITVHLRGGVYPLEAPVVFEPADTWPVTFKAYGRETPVISGARRITDWRIERVNGRQAWVADLPEVAAGRWYFRQLFVNGRRADRPRLPRTGLYRMEQVPGLKLPTGWGKGGYTRFVCRDGDVRSFANLQDTEIVYLHFWIEERSPVEAFDETTHTVTMRRPSRAPLIGSHGTQLADYYIDNVFEALDQPGQWYLDRAAGRLTYLPRRGEDPRSTDVFAPCALQLLALLGKPEENRYVEFIRFEGLTFAHADWRHPDASDGAAIVGASGDASPSFSRRYNRGHDASAAQAACDVPGVIVFEGARHCALENCTIEHVGWYGVEIGDACHDIRLVGNRIQDMGAGGVKINGAAARDPHVALRRTGGHRITDNTIRHGGRVFHSAVGVLSMNAFGLRIAHNHIYDLFYSGISCGWEWGYQENVSRDNRIEYNHIHDLGHRLLSDMGGIYTLGVQPGTILRGNLIYNVTSAHYGGWCIYPDEGSSHLLIEHNVCYDADRQPFHQHYGRENVIRNNIWVFGGEAVARYSRFEPHRGFTWTRNIMVTNGKPIWFSNHDAQQEKQRMVSDLNLFYDVSGKPPVFQLGGGKTLSFKQWRRLGYDAHSIVANPRFRDIARRDFTLRPNSPAFKLGFEPIDVSRVGPRPSAERQ